MDIIDKFKKWYTDTEKAQQYADNQIRTKEQNQQQQASYNEAYKMFSVELADVIDNIKENLNVKSENPRDLWIKPTTKETSEYTYKILCNRTNNKNSDSSFIDCSEVEKLLRIKLDEAYIQYKFDVKCRFYEPYYYITLTIVGNRDLRFMKYTGNRGKIMFKQYQINEYQFFRDIYIAYPDKRYVKLSTGKNLEILYDFKWLNTTIEDNNGIKFLSGFDFDTSNGCYGRLGR